MRTTHRREISENYEFTAGDVRALLEGVPDHATVRPSETAGDRPFDSGTVSLEVSWSEDK